MELVIASLSNHSDTFTTSWGIWRLMLIHHCQYSKADYYPWVCDNIYYPLLKSIVKKKMLL